MLSFILDFISGLGCILGAYLVLRFIDYIKRKDSHYTTLAKYIRVEEFYPDRNFNSYEERVKYIFKHNPNVLKRAKELYKEDQERLTLEKNEERKKLAQTRVFAYDYENDLYQIYSDVANKRGGIWRVSVKDGFNKEYIIQKLSELRHISIPEAQMLFEELVKREILIQFFDTYYLSSLLTDLGYWNIISNNDMNLHKWMIAHGYEE